MKAKTKQEDKDRQAQYLENYGEMVRKVQVLSRLGIRQFIGTRPDGDPRAVYLTGLETFRNLANVHLEVITALAIKKLGVSRDDFLKLQAEELANQVKVMEEDLAVKSWDQAGNPIFDLPAYMKRTIGWPK